MKRRRRRCNWPLVSTVTLLVACGAIYVAVMPIVWYWLESLDATQPLSQHAHWVLMDSIRTRLFELLIYGWVFMFGASIGSFLNVVIYRVPRRMSLLGVSKCPFCRVAIRGYDNVPVFAWLALRGRCRSCRLPISIRYPLVELAIGLLFLVLIYLEVFQAGINLPREAPAPPTTLGWFIGQPQWGLLAIAAYHCFLLSVLFSWAWIQADEQAIPLAYVLLAITVGFTGAALRPDVHPVAWPDGLPDWTAAYGWIARLDDSFVGFVAGAAMGAVVVCLRHVAARIWRRPIRSQGAVVASCTMVGVFLGWQATVFVVVLASVIEVATKCLWRFARSASHLPSTAFIFLAALLQVVGWRLLTYLAGWPFPGIEL